MASGKKVKGLMRVAVVDDDEDIRLYFKDVLQSATDFVFVKGFSNATEALAGMPCLQPDLVLMDIRMPDLNGIECTKRLKNSIPHLKIIIITGTHNADSVKLSMRAGADAYLTKPITPDQCLATLRFMAAYKVGKKENTQPSRLESFSVAQSGTCLLLSPRESEVLKNLAKGLLYKEISDKLGISYASVHKYQHKIFQKLQVSNRSEAIRIWLDSGGE
jgi:DNA-binding NarL/FixJ family response regulator